MDSTSSHPTNEAACFDMILLVSICRDCSNNKHWHLYASTLLWMIYLCMTEEVHPKRKQSKLRARTCFTRTRQVPRLQYHHHFRSVAPYKPSISGVLALHLPWSGPPTWYETLSVTTSYLELPSLHSGSIESFSLLLMFDFCPLSHDSWVCFQDAWQQRSVILRLRIPWASWRHCSAIRN